MKTSKRDRAVEIYNTLKASQDGQLMTAKDFREAVKTVYKTELGMSDAGANTYFYFARDAADGKLPAKASGTPKKAKKAADVIDDEAADLDDEEEVPALRRAARRRPTNFGQVWGVRNAKGEVDYFLSESAAREFAEGVNNAEVFRDERLEA